VGFGVEDDVGEGEDGGGGEEEVEVFEGFGLSTPVSLKLSALGWE